jgi:protein-disulfide isomerase
MESRAGPGAPGCARERQGQTIPLPHVAGWIGAQDVLGLSRNPAIDGDLRMKFLAPLAFAGLIAASPAAADLTDLSDAERAAFRAEVRAYLLDNPEVLMEAIAVLEERETAAQSERDEMTIAANADALFRSAFDWVGGNPEGDLVLVEFMDYRCGFCRRAHPEVADLIELDGNIRYIVKEFPILGEQSVLASRFAIATRIVNGDDAYARMNDALMVMRGDVTSDGLAGVARDLDLDPAPIFAAMDDPLVTQTINYNRELATRLQITGTPSFVFGDQLVRGYVPLDGMLEIVDTVRAEMN